MANSDNKVFDLMTATADQPKFDFTEMINKVQESIGGRKAVSAHQFRERKKESDRFHRTLHSYEKHKHVLDNWDTYKDKSEELKKAFQRGLDINLKKLKDMGYVRHIKRNDGSPDDVVMKDMNIVHPGSKDSPVNAGGMVYPGSNQLFIKQRPKDRIGQMKWESVYQHERGHQRRMQKDPQAVQKDLDAPKWHQRKEEQRAMRDQVEHLRGEFERADLEYRPVDAYRLLDPRYRENTKLEAVPNPTKASRMKYLPTGPEPELDIGKTLNDLWNARVDFHRGGTDIRYDTDYFPSLNKIGHYKTKWDIANE